MTDGNSLYTFQENNPHCVFPHSTPKKATMQPRNINKEFTVVWRSVSNWVSDFCSLYRNNVCGESSYSGDIE